MYSTQDEKAFSVDGKGCDLNDGRKHITIGLVTLLISHGSAIATLMLRMSRGAV